MVRNENSTPDSTTVSENRTVSTSKGVPCGKYKLIGWGIDTTGRRLIDEICQVAAYSPRSQFSQYIMPFGDLNPIFRGKHNIEIVNTNRYRMLRNIKTNKFLKTKSEISALTDFVKWLEDNREDAVDGIILIYHEVKKFSPGMLLEALQRCNLLEKFCKVVKGFVNSYDIAKEKCANITKAFSLRVLSRVLLNKEGDFSSAVECSKTAFDVTAHLAQGERQDLDKPNSESSGMEAHLIELVCPFTNTVAAEQDEVVQLKVLLQRQNTFKPVFGALLRASRTERQHATHLRKLLAENNINYEKLKAAYEAGAKEGLDKLLKAELFQVANAKEKDLDELLEILDCFFDPEKRAVRPKPRFQGNTNGNRRPPFGPRSRSGGGARSKSFSKKERQISASETNSANASSDNPITNSGASNVSSPRSDGDNNGLLPKETSQKSVAVVNEKPVSPALAPQSVEN